VNLPRSRAAAVSFSLLLLAAETVASEEAHHGSPHAEHHGIPWATLFFTLINFTLFVGVLARFVWPQVKLWIRERHTTVVAELQAAARAKQEAEELRAEWRLRMERLDADLEALRAEARRDIANERERILAAANKAADVIRRDAERAAAAEVRRVQEQLRAELVQSAVKLATETTRKGWSPDDQQRAIDEFLRQV
jgi:F-type H+-transporting ATPase subunit b